MPITSTYPGYLACYHSGELARRAQALEARLASCDICPRKCRVNRLAGKTGFCHSGYLPLVASFCAHHGEEPALSGSRGSGTIFFANCNMRCVYCQNYQISQDRKSPRNELDFRALAGRMIYLQDKLGCHNINLVSPSHFIPQIVRAVLEAVPMGLYIPLVYNSSGHDSVEVLKELDGIVDIFLPDLRYADNRWAGKFSCAPDYVSYARPAIAEMYRQVGNLVLDENGIARRGLIIRHLILPNGIAGSGDSLAWIARGLSPSVTVSIMSQYLPMHRAVKIPVLSRKITAEEYSAVLELLPEFGLDEGWIQEMESAESYVPDFNRDGHPFV